MNRRSFVSMLLGAAGAPLVPWRGLTQPTIFLPERHTCGPWCRHPNSILPAEILAERMYELACKFQFNYASLSDKRGFLNMYRYSEVDASIPKPTRDVGKLPRR